MLIPAFQINLNNTIQKGLVTVGKYDGKHPCLTCVTSGGKIFIHNPHEKDVDEKQIKFLNINRDISSIIAAPLNPEKSEFMLLIGTATNLLAYDVEKNADIFYREISDGLNCMTWGKLGSVDVPLVLVGGNCAIQGYDHQGNEQYWTTAGGNVAAIILNDVDEDGNPELLVGSDDYSIYIYQDEAVLSEVTETDQLVGLCDMRFSKYGYALGNGTVGVYDGEKRMWRTKSKDTVTSIVGFDLDGDGIPELISGWNNGRIEVRSEKNGSLIYKDQFQSSISSIIKADYRLDGKEEIICCSYTGEVKGYLPADQEMKQNTQIDNKLEEQAVMELNQRKDELLYELKNYEENLRRMKTGEFDAGLISHNTKVTCHLQPNEAEKCVDIVFQTESTCVIKVAILSAEQLFENESTMIYAKEPSNSIKVSLNPPKDITVDMNIQVLVGHNMAAKYHVFELNYKMPKFSMYLPVPEFSKPPVSSVVFSLTERTERIVQWLNNSFNISYQPEGILDIKFISLRNGTPLNIIFKDGKLYICCDEMEVAGELVQDCCVHLQIKQLQSYADFPLELKRLKTVLERVEEFNNTRLRLTADMADSSQEVKSLVIKAEDSRILGDMKLMRNTYNELYNTNKALIGEYMKRSNNHQQLLRSLKEVNIIIQRAAKLRVGDFKTKIISDCRAAIKASNTAALYKIIQYGTSELK